MKYVNTWDLESIFPGGTKSKQLQEKLTKLEQKIVDYESMLTSWNYTGDATSIDTLKELLNKQEIIVKGIMQANSFVRMSLDAYMDDEYGQVVLGQVMDLISEIRKLDNIYTKKLVDITDDDWSNLLEDADLREVAFVLSETREKGKRLLSEAEETLLAKLDKDGLNAWSQLYDTTVSIITITLPK